MCLYFDIFVSKNILAVVVIMICFVFQHVLFTRHPTQVYKGVYLCWDFWMQARTPGEIFAGKRVSSNDAFSYHLTHSSLPPKYKYIYIMAT